MGASGTALLMEPTASSQLGVFRSSLPLRVRGSVWPVKASLFRYGGGYRQCVLFSVGEGGQTEWCICCSGRFPCSRRGKCVGRGDRMVRRETGIWFGRACARDGSGYGRRFAGFGIPPLVSLKGGNQRVLWPVLPDI